MTVFGTFVPTIAVQDAVRAVLDVWSDTYLAVLERQMGLTVGSLQRPRYIGPSFDNDNWPEGQLPAILIVCPGPTGGLERHGSGQYGGMFAVQVSVLVEDTTEENAIRVASVYQSAIEGELLQRGALGGIATSTEMRSRLVEAPDPDNNRTLARAVNEFDIFVDAIVTAGAGPATPAPPTDPEAPVSDWPHVSSTDVTVNAEPIS